MSSASEGNLYCNVAEEPRSHEFWLEQNAG